ncbi:craniofacial development protein 1-like protein [Camelus ferus]|nr:craniofacial development protein 1-like protein [Camelus ferus]
MRQGICCLLFSDIQGGEYSEDDVNELVKEDEVDGEEQTQKTKGKKRKAQSIPARKRKQGLSLEEEEEDANEESGGSSSEEEDAAAEQEKGIGAEDARKKKEDELWASFLNDVGPKSKVPPSTQVKREEETEETGSSKLLVKAEELEKPKETEKVKITKVFDFAGEEVRVTKEVDATSKEAKSFFKQNEKEKPQTNVPAALPSLPAGSGYFQGPQSSDHELQALVVRRCSQGVMGLGGRSHVGVTQEPKEEKNLSACYLSGNDVKTLRKAAVKETE